MNRLVLKVRLYAYGSIWQWSAEWGLFRPGGNPQDSVHFPDQPVLMIDTIPESPSQDGNDMLRYERIPTFTKRVINKSLASPAFPGKAVIARFDEHVRRADFDRLTDQNTQHENGWINRHGRVTLDPLANGTAARRRRSIGTSFQSPVNSTTSPQLSAPIASD
jgi:hypothetical protein